MKRMFVITALLCLLISPAFAVTVPDQLLAHPVYSFDVYTVKFLSYEPFDANGGVGTALIQWAEQIDNEQTIKRKTVIFWVTKNVYVWVDFKDGYQFIVTLDGNLHQVIKMEKPIILKAAN